jgi:hypothetical protein
MPPFFWVKSVPQRTGLRRLRSQGRSKCRLRRRSTHRGHTREGGYPVCREFSVLLRASRNTGSSGQVFAGDDGGDIVCGHNSAFSRHHPPEFCKFIRPKNNRAQRDPQERAQGRAGARCTRGLMCQDAHSKKRTRAYRFSGSSPAFPAQWFTAYFVLSPVRPGLLVTVAPKKRELLASLTPAIGASGPHVYILVFGETRRN